DGAELAFRSRELVTDKVFGDLDAPEEVVGKLEPEFQKAVYGDKGTSKSARQTLLLGEREIAWLKSEAQRLVREADGNAEQAKKLAEGWRKDFRANTKVMRDAATLPGG